MFTASASSRTKILSKRGLATAAIMFRQLCKNKKPDGVAFKMPGAPYLRKQIDQRHQCILGRYVLRFVEAKFVLQNPDGAIDGTTCLALAAGVDFIDLYLDGELAPSQRTADLSPFQDRLRLKRSWHNEFLLQ